MTEEKETSPATCGSYLEEWKRLGLIPETTSKPSQPMDISQYAFNQRMRRWQELAPPEFQKAIVPDMLENRDAWAQADEWHGEYPGIWLWSHSTGKAKTRMLWRKFGELYVRKNRSVMRISGMNLAETYHDSFNRNHTDEFYRRFRGLNCIMLDDLDKMNLPGPDQGFAEQAIADRNARMLRELFDDFYEGHIPVLVTANENIKHFAERVGPSTERRMREVCREIAF